MRRIAFACVAFAALAGVAAAMPSATAAGAGTITGTVRAADTGHAIGGVRVDVIGTGSVHGPFGPITGPVVVGTATSAADGTYSVSGLDTSAPDPYFVCFDAFNGSLTVYDSQCYDNAAGFAPFPDPFGFLQPAAGSTPVGFNESSTTSGIDASLVRIAPGIMIGRAYALSSNGLLKINPVADTGVIAKTTTSTLNKCAVPLRVGLLLAARALCSNVTSLVSPIAGVSAGSSVANVELGLTGLPAIQLRTVSASSGTGCGGSNGTTEIGFLKIGTKVLISNLVHPGPNTTINILGIKLILNEQIHGPGALTVNAVHLSIGSLENLVIASATTAMTACP